MQAISSVREGGSVSYVGIPHGVELDGETLFLRLRSPARRTGSRAPLPASAYQPRVEQDHRSQQGFRPPCLSTRSRRVPRDGRATDDQDAAASAKTSTGKGFEMTTWLKNDLGRIADTDDLHISPLREGGRTYGTTWIWSVVVDGALYVRAYNGKESLWYKAALRQKAGRITAAGMTEEVTFEPVGGQIKRPHR